MAHLSLQMSKCHIVRNLMHSNCDIFPGVRLYWNIPRTGGGKIPSTDSQVFPRTQSSCWSVPLFTYACWVILPHPPYHLQILKFFPELNQVAGQFLYLTLHAV